LQGRAFALLGVPDAQLGQRCTLLVQGAVFEPEWPRIKEVCESVQRYSAPKALYFTVEWPLSDNGKLLRRELLAILQRGEAIHFAACS
jgi:acyl-coenzyme A synthetase/AMP-(fatty) acid ligase